ncbi:hypothetical protein GFK96_17800 [Pseudomonas stutzeri]|nr:hypothetical protein [Stutzerimonas stutzeri]MBK3852232.1 hypothetical protein [Stutzerimonas stutzeri]
MFSCSKIEQKQLSTWVSFQSAEQSLLGQFSVSGNRLLPPRGNQMWIRPDGYRMKAFVTSSLDAQNG